MATLTASQPIDMIQSPVTLAKSPSSTEKLNQIFKNLNVTAACMVNPLQTPAKHLYRIVGGMIGGNLLSCLCASTGPTVALHEIVGHGFLGLKSTNVYKSGADPHFQIDGWDNFQEILKATSFKDRIVAIFNWIRGYDCNVPGFAGETYPGQPDGPNQLGQAMGQDGQSAWISVAGSLPGLTLDSLSVIAGMELKNRIPALSWMLIAMGLTDHVVTSYYPITAALMSQSEMQNQSLQGHDFANFAIRMGKVTGVSAQTIAISMATIWSTFVPLVAALAYLHSKSHAGDIVPDAIAMKEWMQKAEKDPKIAEELERLLAAYPQKDNLLEIEKMLSDETSPLTDEQIEIIQAYSLDFVDYLFDKVPTNTIANEKLEILDSWQKNVKPDRIQAVSVAFSLASSITTIASRIFQILSTTIAPTLAVASTILTYSAPAFAITSALSFGHRIVQDFKCPDSVVPKSAKILSVATLVTAATSAVLIALATFMAGLNMAMFGVLIFGTLANIACSYARSRIIQGQFVLSQAVKPEVMNVMHALWLKHLAKPAGAKMNETLKNWVNIVHPEKAISRTQQLPNPWKPVPAC